MHHTELSELERAEHFREGVHRFNIARFWHAHEAWEICWLHAREPDAIFYKGLIQAAAALVHWQKGNPRGLRRNWYKGRPKLVAVLPGRHRLDVQALVNEMDAFVLAEGTEELVPKIRMLDA